MRRPLPDLPPSWPPSYPLHRPVESAISRQLDQEAEAWGVPSFCLMEHASMGVAAIAAAMAGAEGRIVVLCGPGNNGGDGYGAARFLKSWGFSVRTLSFGPRAPAGDAGQEHGILVQDAAVEDAWALPHLVAEAVREAEVVVDALFGVGLGRALEGPYPDWIRDVNAADALRLAVDVPSGLDADNGSVLPVAVKADVTATMAMPKQGLVALGPGAEHAGLVIEIDIGLPSQVHRPFLRG